MIEIKGLKKHYGLGDTLVKAVDGIDLTVEKGEYIAIVGPSGSGKSTLMNLIGCLDTPTEGSYKLDSIDVSKMNDNELASVRNRKIGFVFQSFNLLPKLNSLENVALPLIYSNISSKERKDKSIDKLKRVGLENRLEHKPNELSGGQKQRVAIARALVTDPAIILADEPTGNLDSHSTKEVMALLDDLHKVGATIILITHEDNVASHAKRILTISDGIITTDRRIG